MKLLVKLFIYLTIIVVISVFNNVAIVEAKPRGGMSDLMRMQEPPQDAPKMESAVARMRRNIDAVAADGGDMPKDPPAAPFRTRRDAPPDAPQESDAPKHLENSRAKRQLPPPPPGSENIPMPPM